MLLAACTPGPPKEPPVASFASGTCRKAAPAVIMVDRLVHQVRDQHKKPQAVEQGLAVAQRQLRAVPAGSDRRADGLLTQLVTDIGLLRIGLDTNNYHDSQLDRVAGSQQAIVKYCTRTSR